MVNRWKCPYCLGMIILVVDYLRDSCGFLCATVRCRCLGCSLLAIVSMSHSKFVPTRSKVAWIPTYPPFFSCWLHCIPPKAILPCKSSWYLSTPSLHVKFLLEDYYPPALQGYRANNEVENGATDSAGAK